jgi:arylformamidase
MIYDVSTPLSPETQVWPGDVGLSREVLAHIDRGDRTTGSALRTTVHIGTHADAPCHYGSGAAAIDKRDLGYYLGPCQVVAVAPGDALAFGPESLTAEITQPRVLLKTDSYPDPHNFHEGFRSCLPELIDWLADRGVRTIGVDTPSVDVFAAEELPSHARCLARDLAIIEGLRLGEVPPGVYELIALPLRLVGFDASPVRAVLRSLPD